MFYIPCYHMAVAATVILIVWPCGLWAPREPRETAALSYCHCTPTGLRTTGPRMLWFVQVSPLFSRAFLMFLHLKCRVARGSSVQSNPPIVYHLQCHINIHFLTFDHHLKCLPLSLTLFLFFLSFSCPLGLFLAFFNVSGIPCQRGWGVLTI